MSNILQNDNQRGLDGVADNFRGKKPVVAQIYEFDIWTEKKIEDRKHWQFVDFISTDGGIDFHVSLRPQRGTVIVNGQSAGEWGEEEELSVNTTFSKKLHVVCEKDRIDVFIDRCKVHTRISKQVPHKINTNISSGYSLVDKDDFVQSVARQRKSPAEPIVLTKYGHQLSLLSPEMLQQQTPHLAEMVKSLDEYLCTQIFHADGLIVEHSQSSGIIATLVGAAISNNQIICIVETPDEKKMAEQLVTENRLGNVKVMEIERWQRLLRKRKLDALPVRWSKGSDADTTISFIGYNMFRDGKNEYTSLCQTTLLSNVLLVETKPVPACQLHFDKIKGATQVSVYDTDWQLKWDQASAPDMQPQLDVVVSMYNAKEYIIECIESILTKKRPDVHVLVIDDGSNDGSRELVTDYCRKNSQVRIVTKANGGCASARNYGRLHSRASHITFIDADDFVDDGYYAELFDVAMYSGYEMVQGEFDFFDVSKETPYYDNYEKNEFATLPRIAFGESEIYDLQASWIIRGQPSIWRRVYRRDFLDNKKLYFPEHIRAFDDWYFQACSLIYAGNLYALDGPKYHYRQHASQDIRQADERHFYELEMARMMLNLSLKEGWNNFYELVPTIVNCINWSVERLRKDLMIPFLKGAARIWIMIEKSYGPSVFNGLTVKSIKHLDFERYYKEELQVANKFGSSYSWSFLNDVFMQPETLRMFARSE